MFERTDARPDTELKDRRTAMAAERTLLAWIRTSMAMISFGFTIGRLGDALSSSKVHLLGRDTDVVGLAYFLVVVGTVALIVAAIQYRRDMRVFDGRQGRPPDITFIVAILLGLLGLFAFADLVKRF
jgi:putative membrane protein